MHPLSFIRGALFGAFVMYLFAPRSGVETRRMFTEKGQDLKNSLGDLANTVKNEVTAAGQSNTTEEPIPLPSSTYKPMTYQS
jgi:gas vesicle protein